MSAFCAHLPSTAPPPPHHSLLRPSPPLFPSPFLVRLRPLVFPPFLVLPLRLRRLSSLPPRPSAQMSHNSTTKKPTTTKTNQQYDECCRHRSPFQFAAVPSQCTSAALSTTHGLLCTAPLDTNSLAPTYLRATRGPARCCCCYIQSSLEHLAAGPLRIPRTQRQPFEHDNRTTSTSATPTTLPPYRLSPLFPEAMRSRMALGSYVAFLL